MSIVTFTKLGRYGRAGNQLFQVASTIGVAVRHGYDYAFPPWLSWDTRFPPELNFAATDEDIDMQSYFANPLPLLDESLPLIVKDVSWGYDNLVLPAGNWDLRGHMQSEKYFAHCRPLIKQVFMWSFKAVDSALLYIDYFHAGLREAYNSIGDAPFCCVQFRRGDYVTKAGYHPVIGRDYYEKALAEIPSGCKLLVFGEYNDQEAREIIGPDAIYITSNMHFMTRMCLASLCEHFILANSTYFWMPAWLAETKDKVVTVPRQWFGPEAGGLPATDIPAEGWKVIG